MNVSSLKELHPKLARVYERLIKDLIKNHLIGSTLVEGSTFTENEAFEVLSGKTVHGHSIDEHRELLNGQNAASFIHRLFFERTLITTKLLDQAHEILFDGIGNPKKTNPGKNRGSTGKSAFTHVVRENTPVRVTYEAPSRVKTDYKPYIDRHINRSLPSDRKEATARLAQVYFHFEMLHPYNDGNGRLGRLLVSAKAAAEKGWFFRFEVKDGPEHLRTMVALTLDYMETKDLDYSGLEAFLDSHLEAYD